MQFLEQIGGDLHQPLEHPQLVSERLYSLVVGTFEEIDQDRLLLAETILSGDYDGPLSAAGLSGAQLEEAKLAGYNFARDAYFSRLRLADPDWPWLRRLYLRILKWLNIIIGTLVAVVGVGEMLKEGEDVH